MILFCQILVVLLLVALGGFFAGSETGVYRLSRFQLRVGIEERRPFYALLGQLMDDSYGMVFSMLIATNLVHYVVTSIVTFMLVSRVSTSGLAEVYATVIMTPILFVFAEVIPKNIYYYHADVLMYRFGPLLWFFHKLFTWSGAVAGLKIISQISGRWFGVEAGTPAVMTADRGGYIKQIIRESHDEGILSGGQNVMMNRLMDIQHIRVNSVKTALHEVEMIENNANKAQLMARLGECEYTRLPVYQGDRDNIVGFINIYEVLGSSEDFRNLDKFRKPIGRFNAAMTVIDAINKMRTENHKIVLVASGRGPKDKVVGIITMKDLVEELTGELAQW